VIDYKFVRLIENVGYTNDEGKRIYGTAALLHLLHCPVKQLNPKHVELGRAYVKKLMNL
jgi:hypothetical protein